MIGSSRRLKVYLCRDPVDMRKSFNTLSAVVEQAMKREVLSGELFAFINKRRKRAKVLWWDGTGLCVLAKRLEKGRFMAPWLRPGEGPVRMTANELALLLGDSAAVTAMLDRLLHHAHVVKFGPRSWRTKGKTQLSSTAKSR